MQLSADMAGLSKIAVLTSGGDAPGLNACIRAIFRAATYYQVEVVGVQGGYDGMIDGNFVDITTRAIFFRMIRSPDS